MNNFPSMKWAISCFKFFASLKLAVVLIMVLAVVFAVGTFLESYHGTEAAQLLVYQRGWFNFLLALLALNLLASALDRLPWKKKHIGFLTTHLGIILILIGSLMTHAFGLEGQLAVEEGKMGNRISIARPLLEVFSVSSAKQWVFQLKSVAFPWSGRKELVSLFPSPFKIVLLHQYPKSKALDNVYDAAQGSPALHVSIKGSMAESGQWLFLSDDEGGGIVLGLAVIRFSTQAITTQSSTSPDMGKLKFQFENGKTAEVPIDQRDLTKVFPLEGTPYRLQLGRILKDAVVDGNRLTDRSNRWENPAVEFTLEGKGLLEHHTVFAKFPDFPTLHGLKPSAAGVRVTYEIAQFAGASKNELRFVFQKGTLPKYQIVKSGQINQGTVELGKEVKTGWMDLKFTVDRYLEHAERNQTFSPLPSGSNDPEAISAIQIELEKKEGEKRALWLSQGTAQHMVLEGEDFHVIYGLATVPLGFQIELRDFLIETDPGTDRPASFKSEVTLNDPSRGIRRDFTIQMNQPLKYRGFKIFQSGYQQVPNMPDVTIFTVARDPGIAAKYAGAIVMISGIIMLFYIKPFSTLKSSDPKLRKK